MAAITCFVGLFLVKVLLFEKIGIFCPRKVFLFQLTQSTLHDPSRVKLIKQVEFHNVEDRRTLTNFIKLLVCFLVYLY